MISHSRTRHPIVVVSLVFLASLGLSLKLCAEEISHYEIGASFGAPAAVNIEGGIWLSPDLPLVLRASGMYYGETRGLQIEAGYGFDPDGKFRQSLTLGFTSTQVSASTSVYRTLSFTGVGPFYTFNLYGVMLQVGLSFGQTGRLDSTIFPSPQVLGKLGYVFWL